MTSSKYREEKMPTPHNSKEIMDRKIEHLKIPLEYDVQHSKNYFNDIKLIHHPIPEIDFEDIDLSVKFFNKNISAPICISAITGGHPISQEINEILAKAAEEENIIMSVGSQRAGIEDPALIDSFRITRKVAPNIPIIGNIGIGQVSDPNFDVANFNECIEMINADVMAIHLNALHELVQNKGDISFKLFRANFKNLRENSKIPIIAKEVGTGINRDLALVLDKIGIDGFDVGGSGGTSFAAIESKRNHPNKQKYTRDPADVFREWGIPTPVSIIYVRNVSQKLIIATGGLRTGVDIAKSIALGADIGGFAYKFLKTAWNDRKSNSKSISHSVKEIRTLKNELRSCLWLMNMDKIEKLKGKRNKCIILGELYKWLNQ
jgi:isopentenyl-diphosphate delta-isomerase